MTRFVVILIAVLTSGAFTALVPAQQAAPAQTELLTEVRLLRQAIESLAGTNARLQIVFGRLQLQEQRTTAASQRLEEARSGVIRLSGEIAQLNEHLKDLEAALGDATQKPDRIEGLRGEARQVRRQIELSEGYLARRTAEEAEATVALNLEQGRWSDLNRQLDELERLLTRPQ